jgi:4-carboxymuconolactone decarboxylase
MTEKTTQPGPRELFGDVAPALAGYSEDVLFGQAWKSPELSPRDRSLVTVASLITSGSSEQLTFHLPLAQRNGVTEAEDDHPHGVLRRLAQGDVRPDRGPGSVPRGLTPSHLRDLVLITHSRPPCDGRRKEYVPPWRSSRSPRP